MQAFQWGVHLILRNKLSKKFQLNPFTPKLKKYILPTFKREKHKWGSENG